MSEDLILLYAFADIHHVNRNEARRRWSLGLIPGKKQGPGRQAAIVLDAQGMRNFYVQFHETQSFHACDNCPHT